MLQWEYHKSSILGQIFWDDDGPVEGEQNQRMSHPFPHLPRAVVEREKERTRESKTLVPAIER